VKRLGEVVVAAGAEAGEAIGDRVARREEQDGRRDALGPQRLADVAAVGVGEADVDDQGVDRVARRHERRGAVADGGHREALLLEAARDQRAELGVVLDDDQAMGGHALSVVAAGSSARRWSEVIQGR
jgi:hypothetical protein